MSNAFRSGFQAYCDQHVIDANQLEKRSENNGRGVLAGRSEPKGKKSERGSATTGLLRPMAILSGALGGAAAGGTGGGLLGGHFLKVRNDVFKVNSNGQKYTLIDPSLSKQIGTRRGALLGSVLGAGLGSYVLYRLVDNLLKAKPKGEQLEKAAFVPASLEALGAQLPAVQEAVFNPETVRSGVELLGKLPIGKLIYLLANREEEVRKSTGRRNKARD